jgi:hypothetical protein
VIDGRRANCNIASQQPDSGDNFILFSTCLILKFLDHSFITCKFDLYYIIIYLACKIDNKMKQICHYWFHILTYFTVLDFPIGKQKINSPSWTNAPIQYQGSSIYFNQHVPQYAFPYPVYRYII